MGTNGEGPQIINKSIRLTPIDDLARLRNAIKTEG